ncbi:hypothetical protein ElyMa_000826800 [Elysia marginata]|uniref:Uncharacterized protein n=1 Tax=Elysia marginata TaxID=1093978 RepID=A0AAV4GZQ2_9GAST|nr:hypothetical protein ElyMa_000826800 [Elysia marginata]
MTAGDNLLKAIVNIVFWLTLLVQRFYSVFHIIGLGGILLIFSVAGGWVFQIVEAPIENRTIQNIIHKRTGVRWT